MFKYNISIFQTVKPYNKSHNNSKKQIKADGPIIQSNLIKIREDKRRHISQLKSPYQYRISVGIAGKMCIFTLEHVQLKSI